MISSLHQNIIIITIIIIVAMKKPINFLLNSRSTKLFSPEGTPTTQVYSGTYKT